MSEHLGRVFSKPRAMRTGAIVGVMALVAATLTATPANAGPSPRPMAKVTMERMPPLAAAQPGDGSERLEPLVAGNFTTVQMNLCNGKASLACYSDGLAIQEAVMTISRLDPNLVSLNEICLGDLTINRTENSETLLQAMRKVRPSALTYYVFMPALKSNTERPYTCDSGEAFGSALMFHVDPQEDWGVVPYGFSYDAQLSTSGEWRTAACAAVYHHYFACTTHLAAGTDAKPVALKQCQEMMNEIIPTLKSESAGRTTLIPTIVQGDFNLLHEGGEFDIERCVPSGFAREDDRDVQHIIVSNDAPIRETNFVGMSNTDHVALVGYLDMPL